MIAFIQLFKNQFIDFYDDIITEILKLFILGKYVIKGFFFSTGFVGKEKVFPLFNATPWLLM